MATKRYAHFDKNGAFQGFYDDSGRVPVPDGAKEITPQQWHDLMAAQASGKHIALDKNGAPAAVDPPLDGIKAGRCSEMEGEAFKVLWAGLPYDFPDSRGTIQTRPGRPDKSNIEGLLLRAQHASGANVTFDFRDAENKTHTLTVGQVADMATAALAFISDVYAKQWAVKDAIRAAKSAAAVRAVKWPSK